MPAKDVIKIEDTDNEEFNLVAGFLEEQDVPSVMPLRDLLLDGEVATSEPCIDTGEDEWDRMEKEYGRGARASHVESLHGADDLDSVPQSSSSDDSSDSDSSSVHPTFLCGRRIADSYVFLQHGASFKWPRCTACFRGQVTVITTPGGSADAFDRAPQSRLARQL